jgi:hypothetical protein
MIGKGEDIKSCLSVKPYYLLRLKISVGKGTVNMQ